MPISDIRATPVSVPLRAPLRHANGCHWGRYREPVTEALERGLLTEADIDEALRGLFRVHVAPCGP